VLSLVKGPNLFFEIKPFDGCLAFQMLFFQSQSKQTLKI